MVFTEKFAGWSNCFGKWHLFTDNTKSPQIGAINFFNLGLSGSGLVDQFSFRFLMGLALVYHSVIGWSFGTGFGFGLRTDLKRTRTFSLMTFYRVGLGFLDRWSLVFERVGFGFLLVSKDWSVIPFFLTQRCNLFPVFTGPFRSTD